MISCTHKAISYGNIVHAYIFTHPWQSLSHPVSVIKLQCSKTQIQNTKIITCMINKNMRRICAFAHTSLPMFKEEDDNLMCKCVCVKIHLCACMRVNVCVCVCTCQHTLMHTQPKIELCTPRLKHRHTHQHKEYSACMCM